jgi:hypothetical protein
MRYWWNDKEVTEEEYKALDDAWRKQAKESENSSQEESSKKKKTKRNT